MEERLVIKPGMAGFVSAVDQSVRRRPSHRHEELEVNLVVAGKASYLFGNRRVPLLAGSMIWFFPRQEHVLIDWSGGFSMWVAVFRRELVNRFATAGTRRVLRTQDPGDVFCRQIDPEQIGLLHRVYQSAAREETDEEFINAALGYALVASWQAYQFSSYIREHVRLTTQPIEEPDNPEHLLQIFEMMDAKNTVMFSSDYPHWDFDNPRMALPPLRGELKERILWRNAAELYHLEGGPQ